MIRKVGTGSRHTRRYISWGRRVSYRAETVKRLERVLLRQTQHKLGEDKARQE